MRIVIADTGPLISLIHLDKLELLSQLFDDFYIAGAVWKELINYGNSSLNLQDLQKLHTQVKAVDHEKEILSIMDLGEAESVLLYQNLSADYLLIEDSKARKIAEGLGINCIGTLGLLVSAKKSGLIDELNPVFKKLILKGRYFSKVLLNKILCELGEKEIE